MTSFFDDYDMEVLQNRLKERVLPLIEEMLNRSPSMCRCRDCRLDVAAIVLNRCPANYVVSDLEKEISQKVDDQEIIRQIEEAFDIVASNPHHLKQFPEE